MNVSEFIIKTITGLGTNHLFGIPGKAIYPLILATDTMNASFILTRHEAGAGFAATGYGLLNGKLGVALGTSGPGGTNMLTAAGQANALSAPVLFITGHPSAKNTGKPYAQDSSNFGTDLVPMFKPVTKFSASIYNLDQVPNFLYHAIHEALTPPFGPVHLNIPCDILSEEIKDIPPFFLNIDTPTSSNIPLAINYLQDAKRPLLLAGKGIHSTKSYVELEQFSERFNLPVATTPGGKGTFSSSHPLSLGAYGLGGNNLTQEYMESGIDILVVIGTKLTDMSLPNLQPQYYPKQVIQLDWNPSIVGKSLPVPTLPIIGDIKQNLTTLLKQAPPKSTSTSSLSKKTSHPQIEDLNKWSASLAIKIIQESIEGDSVIFSDCGSHSYYAIENYLLKKPGTFFFDDVFAAMGNALSFAIGAKLAAPKKNIVCLTGDGCMMMHGMEIATAVNTGIDILIIIFNNEQLDMVDKAMYLGYGKAVGSKYEKGAHFAKLANSLGALSSRCDSQADLKAALNQFVQPMNCPRVIEVMVPKDEIQSSIKKRMEKL
ncbi:thiamine pyrophosphate-binding protein [Bacillus thuringiensis]|uniref:thiamine pyrophosphate-binding protein n=1 Tax=Bacillus thuringiensis TaxID=1428 RepID=UPI0020D26E09|nr:thiamine pyrophosphate-binding protein [Bacillus thuringiensis]